MHAVGRAQSRGVKERAGDMTSQFPSETRVAIIGGGVMGCSLAYHLTKLGWSDVVLLERQKLTSGTTWHAAGLVGQLRATYNLTRLARYTCDLYASLEEETGQATGFKRNGSLAVATNDERFEEFKRGASLGRTFGLEIEVVTPKEAREIHPLIDTDQAVGGIYVPNDGQTSPIDTTMALAKGARMGGARILEDVKVTAVRQKDGRVTGVETDHGPIEAEFVVNCAGMWGREVGKMAGVSVPLHACEHFYMITDPIPDLSPELPGLRIPDICMYCREDAGKILLGLFEPEAKPWGMDGFPEDFCFTELPEDIDHFMPVLEESMKWLPILQDVGVRKFFCGPESFSPDNRYHLGEAPELENFFVAAGFNSYGIGGAGGAGKALAEWIVEGYPPMDLADVDIRRNLPFQNNAKYLRERVSETLGLLYGMLVASVLAALLLAGRFKARCDRGAMGSY